MQLCDSSTRAVGAAASEVPRLCVASTGSRAHSESVSNEADMPSPPRLLDARYSASRDESPPLLLTIPQAARLLAIGRTTMYGLIDAGDIGVVRIGRSVRVPVAALEQFVEARRAQQPVILGLSSPSDSRLYRARRRG